MPLRNNIIYSETFDFADLGDLRDWLNQFQEIDLSTVYIESGDDNFLRLKFETEQLTDGSDVHNVIVK